MASPSVERNKSRKKRSFVWKYFKEEDSKSNGRAVVCQVEDCNDKIDTVDYSTGPMISHLKIKHGIFVNFF